MHHYRGKLLEGDGIRIDPANVFIQYNHSNASMGEGWYGYLLVPSTQDVDTGKSYILRLEDGRTGRLRVDELTPDDSGKYRAVFVGEEPLG